MANIAALRRLVRQQTNQIGQNVTNIFGAVAGQSPAVLLAQEQKWLVAQIAGTTLLTPDEFYAAYSSSDTRDYKVLQGTDGIIVANALTKEVGQPSTFLIRTVAQLSAPIHMNLAIETDSTQTQFAVYVNGVLQRIGSGSLQVPLALNAGKPIIEICAVAEVIGLAVPPSIRLVYDLDNLPAPVWSNIRTGFLDPVQGTMSVQLEWFNDSRAGGWIVYRRTLDYLTSITGVSTPDPNGSFTVELLGNYENQITAGAEIMAGTQSMGVVQSARFDGTSTNVRVQLKAGENTIQDDWVGRNASIGKFVEQARIRRLSQSSPVTWDDLGVRIGVLYEYVLQAFGLFDELQLSPLSDIRRVVPGDITSPGPIVFKDGYPIVDNNLVTVKFTTPSDLDYEGVRVVYIEEPLNGFGTATGTQSDSTLQDTNKAWTVDEFAGFTVTLTGNTGEGQFATIVGNTSNTLSLDPATLWATVPDGTTTYEITKLDNVVTDYGLCNTEDELTFNIIGEGRYYFCTFDRAQNVESLETAAYWDFTDSANLTTPITNALVFDRTESGQQSQTIMGMSLYSIPAADEVLLDTFEGAYGNGFALLDSGTFSSSGNTTRILQDSSKTWTVNAYAGASVRIATVGSNYGRIGYILSNTVNSLTISTDLPLPPDGQSYQILQHAPNITPTETEYWNVPTGAASLKIIDNQVSYIGSGGEALMHIESTRETDYRYEAVIGRGDAGFGTVGTNLVYLADASGNDRFEFGAIHTSLSTVDIRYRYNSGGAGTAPWTTLKADYGWAAGTSRKLIVELDGDRHTFLIADAFGHNEQVVGRVIHGGVQGTHVGWYVRGASGDNHVAGDSLDSVRMLDFSDLVRIRYSLSPDDDTLEIPVWTGTATDGNDLLLEDTTKQWIPNELVGSWVRITSGAALGSQSKIALNAETTLVPDPAFSAAVSAGDSYIVFNTQYTGTERLQFWAQRGLKSPKILRYHGERIAGAVEPENRLLIDPNSVAELTLNLSETDPGATSSTLLVSIVPDDDVALWRLLLRKNAWPTHNGAAPPTTGNGTPDEQYTKYYGNTDVKSERFVLGHGTWYAIAIPYDSNGTKGPLATASILLSPSGGGGGTGGGNGGDGGSGGGGGGGGGTTLYALNNLLSFLYEFQSPYYPFGQVRGIGLQWDYPSQFVPPDTTGTVNIFLYDEARGINQGETIVQDYAVNAVAPYTTVTGNQGTFASANLGFIFGTKGIDPYVILHFIVSFYVSGVLQGQYETTFSWYGRFNI